MRNLGIKNYKELNKELNKVLEKSMSKLNINAYVTVSKHIGLYYQEWQPKKYLRTYQFLNSTKKIDVTKMGDTYFSQVYVDYENIMYTYFSGEEMEFQDNGLMAIEAANEGNHGYEVSGKSTERHFWDDALNEVYDVYITKDFVELLERQTGCECYLK